MSRLFGRRWRVQVGTLVVSDLDLTFKVKRTLQARPGTCELEVFNLSPAHRAEAVGLPRRQTLVEIQAGYESGISTVFRGDVTKVVSSLDGQTWKTKVTGGDGINAIRSSRVARSFAAGTEVINVVRHLAESMGVGIGNAVEVLRGVRLATGSGAFEDGTVLRGQAAAELTRLCDSVQMLWSIEEGALLLLPMGGSLQRTAIVLSPGTGMVGSPETVNRQTVKAHSLLIPGLVPGQRVVLSSATVSGDYRIVETTCTGDTRGDDWGYELLLRVIRP